MSVTAGQVNGYVSEAQAVADEILATIEGLDPGAAVPAEAAKALVDLFAGLANKALTAWSATADTPITAASVAALMPNATPLTAPTE